MAKKQSKLALEARLVRLNASLHKEKLRVHQVINNLGWGAGMRRGKIIPSYRKENELIEKIREIEDLLTEYKNQ